MSMPLAMQFAWSEDLVACTHTEYEDPPYMTGGLLEDEFIDQTIDDDVEEHDEEGDEDDDESEGEPESDDSGLLRVIDAAEINMDRIFSSAASPSLNKQLQDSRFGPGPCSFLTVGQVMIAPQSKLLEEYT